MAKSGALYSDDEFGLSSGDEAALLEVENINPLKRKSDADLSKSLKVARADSVASTQNVDIARRVLRTRFGHDKFRLKQEQAIDRLLCGNSAVVVFPTGGGKSLCYQVPGLCFKQIDQLSNTRQGRGESGITLVVSPLIALMKDQVDALKRRGICAAALDSSKSREEYLEIVDSMRNGTLDILYCAPERLNNEGFVGSMASVKGGVRLLAVDEAHCISEWGHAFRPDYLKVARFAKEIQAERVVCLTATATPTVAKDVCKAFSIPEEAGLFRTPTYRPNLRLHARSFHTKEESYPALMAFLKRHPGPTIIYATTQNQTEALAEQLRKNRFKARHFHAGMDKDEKISCQEQFMGSADLIVVATIAFGMGIDKSNIRNVVHYDIPSSLEGYSQEIGRAGRDGLESHCVVYLCAEDLHLRESFARGDLPSKKSVTDLLNEIFSLTPTITPAGAVLEAYLYQLSSKFDIKITVLNGIFAQLELRFGLLRATTPKYTQYSYVSISSTHWDTSPSATAVRKHSKFGTTGKAKWGQIDVDMASSSSGVLRRDIVDKLQHWNDTRMVELKTGGVCNVFRVMKGLPQTAHEKRQIADALYKELEVREQQDLGRMRSVMDLITGEACIARTLAEHFGDSLPDGQKECGHCIWCETKTSPERVQPPKRAWDSKAFFDVLKACDARDDPRFLARIAFGIGSPRVTKEKLNKAAVFGSMEDHDFMTLLRAFTKVCES